METEKKEPKYLDLSADCHVSVTEILQRLAGPVKATEPKADEKKEEEKDTCCSNCPVHREPCVETSVTFNSSNKRAIPKRVPFGMAFFCRNLLAGIIQTPVWMPSGSAPCAGAFFLFFGDIPGRKSRERPSPPVGDLSPVFGDIPGIGK